MLAMAFRPFFLLAGVWAVLAMLLWVLRLAGTPIDSEVISPTWHAHEMVFGFGGAVIAGFLLTAARSWTGLPTPSGVRLALFVVLWLAARIAPFALPELGSVPRAVLDASLFVALAASIAWPVIQVRQWKSLAFPVLLVVLAGADAWSHFAAHAGGHGGLMFGLYALVMMMTVIGGRVIPFFTERALDHATVTRLPWLDRATEGATAACTLALLASPFAWQTSTVCLAACFAHVARSVLWHDRRVWRAPLLWVLHLGNAWIGVGFALAGLAALGLAPPMVILHAHTVGALGTLALGMMSRVALGHTGRPLLAPRAMPLAYGAVTLAALFRVFGPMIEPAMAPIWTDLSGALWIAAFGIFTTIYAPILAQPRVDGKPG